VNEPLTAEQQLAVDLIGARYGRVGIVHSGPLAAIAVGYVEEAATGAYSLTRDGGLVNLIDAEVLTPADVEAAVGVVWTECPDCDGEPHGGYGFGCCPTCNPPADGKTERRPGFVAGAG
jgi:hypothetical protein